MSSTGLFDLTFCSRLGSSDNSLAVSPTTFMVFVGMRAWDELAAESVGYKLLVSSISKCAKFGPSSRWNRRSRRSSCTGGDMHWNSKLQIWEPLSVVGDCSISSRIPLVGEG
jgi:hypothetical protein